MPDLSRAEQAAGVRLEKTDEYTRHRDAMKAHGFAVVHGFKADAMRDELLAEVVRLAGELEHTEQRAEDAEAERDYLRDQHDTYIPFSVLMERNEADARAVQAEAYLAKSFALFDEMTEIARKAEADLAAAREENERMTWCANELMRHGRDYQRKRAGYADFWPLIWNDVLDAYAAHAEEAGDDVGGAR